MKHLSALIFVFLSVGTFAQEFPYEFTVTNEAYAHFEDGTDAVLNTWDDPDAMLGMLESALDVERSEAADPEEQSLLLAQFGAMRGGIDGVNAQLNGWVSRHFGVATAEGLVLDSAAGAGTT